MLELEDALAVVGQEIGNLEMWLSDNIQSSEILEHFQQSIFLPFIRFCLQSVVGLPLTSLYWLFSLCAMKCRRLIKQNILGGS